MPSALQSVFKLLIADHFGSAGPIPLQSFKSYKNDLFGEEDGDVLAAETIPAAKPIEITVARPTTPSNRVQQQIALNQQKRLARLQVQLHTPQSSGINIYLCAAFLQRLCCFIVFPTYFTHAARQPWFINACCAFKWCSKPDTSCF